MRAPFHTPPFFPDPSPPACPGRHPCRLFPKDRPAVYKAQRAIKRSSVPGPGSCLTDLPETASCLSVPGPGGSFRSWIRFSRGGELRQFQREGREDRIRWNSRNEASSEKRPYRRQGRLYGVLGHGWQPGQARGGKGLRDQREYCIIRYLYGRKVLP